MNAKDLTKDSMKVTLAGAILLLGLAGGCSKNPAELQKKFMAEGQHYLSEGKTNEAIIEFQNLLKLNPRSAQGRFLLGKAYLQKGWTSEAPLQFLEASKQDPLLIGAHLELAKYGINSGQWRGVKSEITAILKIDPNNVDGWTFSGQRAMALGREKEAEDDLQHALSLNPRSVGATVAMGDLKFFQKHPNQAKALYQRALAKDGKDSRAWTGLGRIAQFLGQTDEAQADFKKAVQVDPSDLRSRIILSNSMAQQGHVRKAINMLKGLPAKAADLNVTVKVAEYETLIGENAKAIRLLHPIARQKIQIPDIYFVLAKAYQNSGRQQDALDMVDRLLSIRGVPPLMKIGAARIALFAGKPDEAKKILSSLENAPHLPDIYWITKGQVELRMNHLAQAVRVIDEGLKNYPDNQTLLLSYVDAQELGKKYKIAMRTLNSLIGKNPKNPAYISRKGILLGRTQGIESEVAYYKNSSRSYPDLAAIEVLYLLSLATNKKVPGAILEAKSYIKIHPNAEIIQGLLSDFYLQTGQKKLAIGINKEILKNNPKNLQALVGLAGQELGDKHFAEAESLYRRALQVSPDDPNLHVGLGEALLSENQRDEALKAFQQALSENPNQPFALLEVAKSEILSGETHRALTHLSPLMKASLPAKRMAQIQWLWGIASEYNGDMKTTQDSLQKAVMLDPKNAFYHASIGDYWATMAKWDKSLSEFDRSLNLHPDNPLIVLKRNWIRIYSSKGPLNTTRVADVVKQAGAYSSSHPDDISSKLIEAQGYILLKKPNQALNIYENILSKYPSERTAILGKAGVLLLHGHLKHASSVITQFLNEHPNDIQGNLILASIDQRSNNLRGTIDQLEKVHQIAPNWVQPALSLASADLALNRFEEAKAISFALHEAHPELVAALYIQANAEMGLKNYRNALKDFKALARDNKNPGPLYNMASVAASKLGDREKAGKYLDLAIKNAPDDPSVLNNMAFYLAEKKKSLATALEYAQKALNLASQPSIQDTMGYVLYRMENYLGAEPHFKAAYDAKFQDPEFLYHMGMNEWKLGKKKLASDLLRKAVVSGILTPKDQEMAQRAIRKISDGT